MSLNTQIRQLENERNKLFDIVEPIKQKITYLYHEINILRNQRDSEIIPKINKNNPGKFWPWILREPGNASKVKYDFREKILRELFDNGTFGYFQETKQVSLKVALTKNSSSSYEKNLKMVKTLLPYLKEVEDNMVIFHIFERSLSANGSYSFMVNKTTGESKVQHRWEKDKVFLNIEEGLKYIQENLWYDGGYDEEED